MTGPHRVTHVVLTDAFAGTEQVVATEARGLAGRGWDVTVVGGDQARMRDSAGAGVRLVPATGVRAGVAALRSAGRPALVHAHLTAAEVAAVAALPWHRAPVVATRHIAQRRGASMAGRLVAPVVRRSLHTQVAISRFVADAVGEPTVLLPNAVPEQAGHPVRREQLVVVLQRLEPEKATHVALEAWAASDLAERGWRLAVVGDGSERARLAADAVRLEVASSVDLVGWVTDPHTWLRRASVLLASATAEPFGLSVVEAMACGTPVLATASGAHPEVLGEVGALFPAGNGRAGGGALRSLALDPQRREQLGRAARARYVDRFSLDAHLDGLEALYRAAAGSRP